jgi:hypothetical protein
MRYISTLFAVFLSITHVNANEYEYKHIALGKWEISDTNYCPNVCALDDEQASSYVGTIIEFTEFSAKIGNEICENPSYLYRHLTSDEFVQGNRFFPSKLGLVGETIIEVTLFCGGSFGERRNGMGSHFYIKNQNEILVGFNGVDFLTRRVK